MGAVKLCSLSFPPFSSSLTILWSSIIHCSREDFYLFCIFFAFFSSWVIKFGTTAGIDNAPVAFFFSLIRFLTLLNQSEAIRKVFDCLHNFPTHMNLCVFAWILKRLAWWKSILLVWCDLVQSYGQTSTNSPATDTFLCHKYIMMPKIIDSERNEAIMKK